MKKEKKLLLASSIISILYMLIVLVVGAVTNTLVSDNKAVNIFQVIITLLVMIGSITFIYYSFSKVDLSKKRKIIIFWSIILFINNIVGGVLGFIVAKKVDKREKRELPKLEIQPKYKWFIYVLIFLVWVWVMFGLSKLYTNKVESILTYIFFVLVTGFIFREDLKRDFKYFKEYFREYSSLVLKTFGKSMIVSAILVISIRLYTGLDTATNQVKLNELFKTMPIVSSILIMFYAPFVEELLFRGLFRKLINKKWVFIIVSGVTFGLAHVIDDFSSTKELLFILVYSNIGLFLASLYYKTNNIFTNMMFHFLQNTLALLAMILLVFFPDIVNLII